MAALIRITLVMSATPIPRSVAMTQFGDVDLSTLREKPAGRGAVHTYLAGDSWRDRWWSFVKERVAEGRQAFVVAPRVGPEVETRGRRTFGSSSIQPNRPPKTSRRCIRPMNNFARDR